MRFANNTDVTAHSELECNLQEIFWEELSRLYDVEQQLIRAFRALIEAADRAELKSALESNLGETRNHISRLEEIADDLGEQLSFTTCQTIEHLIGEGFESVKQHSGTASADAAIIAAVQKAEHYEIASYGAVLSWAGQLGFAYAVKVLRATLEEKKRADQNLATIAITRVKQMAAG